MKVCNLKQKQNHDECRYGRKELDGSGSCKNDYMCSPSMCNCECHKTCKIDDYLDIKKCSCKKRLVGKLVLECEDKI